jgi:hypothetical protein
MTPPVSSPVTNHGGHLKPGNQEPLVENDQSNRRRTPSASSTSANTGQVAPPDKLLAGIRSRPASRYRSGMQRR